jgi:hypothetical protein
MQNKIDGDTIHTDNIDFAQELVLAFRIMVGSAGQETDN